MLLLVEHHRDINCLFRVVRFEPRLGREIDVAELAVEFFVVVECFTQLVGGKNIAFLQRKNFLEEIGLKKEALIWIGAPNRQIPHPVFFALFDLDGDVGTLAVRAPNSRQRQWQSRAILLDCVQDGFVNDDPEVSVILIESADSDFFVFVEFVLIEGLAPNVDIGEVQGNRNRPRMPHRANNPAS